ncbi:MAG: hypothetical protein Kow0022_05600 [Phycisphaerales bacterium]
MLHQCFRVLSRFQALCLIVVPVGLLVLGGCVDHARLAALRDQAALVRDELQTEVARLEQASQSEGAGPEVREAASAAAVELRERLASLDQAITTLDEVASSAQTPDMLINQLTSQAVPLLPEPFRSPALLLGALAAALFRAGQLKRAAGSIAASIAKAAEKDEQFRSAIQRHADTLRSMQTPTAKRIVDERTRDGFMLRLPI